MGRAQGYLRIVDPTLATPLVEFDSILCGHCQRIVMIKPGSAGTVYSLPTDIPGVRKEEPGCFCGKCMTPICIPCHHKGKCRPFELWLDEQEGKITNKLGWGRFFRFVGIGG